MTFNNGTGPEAAPPLLLTLGNLNAQASSLPPSSASLSNERSHEITAPAAACGCAAGNADNFGLCAEFDIRGYAGGLEQQLRVNQHTCSVTLKIRAQDMTQEQIGDSYTRLAAQESYFHQLLASGYNPVANDPNEDPEVAAFDDWNEIPSGLSSIKPAAGEHKVHPLIL